MTNKIFAAFSKFNIRFFFLVAGLLLISQSVSAQTTEFVYQGQLQSSSAPASGNFDFEFLLFDASAGGAQIGSTIARNGVAVANGIFSVNLDFGASFPGANRFLEIRVRQTGVGAFTPLTPRQSVTSTPYSVKSLNADSATNATNATQLGGVAASQFVLTGDARLSDARTPTPGSANYVQNTLVQQAASNFNISGTGTADIFNAATQYNIGGNRALSVAGTLNVFAGVGAGGANTTGSSNSFFGRDAGLANTTGFSNSFFGRGAGAANTTGSSNSFLGRDAGLANTTGFDNAFFGGSAGAANTTGFNNSFFGRSAGSVNTTGNSNSFFGRFAGLANTTGVSNSFFGVDTGASNTTGTNNSFFGRSAGSANTTGFDNAFFGNNAGLTNTTGNSNSFFGRSAGTANTTGFVNAFFGYQAGFSNTTGAGNSFFGRDVGYNNTTGCCNSFFGSSAGVSNTTGGFNSFFGHQAGRANTTGGDNSFFGRDAGIANTTGGNNTIIGNFANVGPGDLTFATAIGASAVVSTSNTIQLSRAAGSDSVLVPGLLQVNLLGAAGATALCRNASNQVSTCSSSLRYKSEVRNFTGGLDIVRRLRPISFNWTGGGMRDVGFGAEEVQKVEPLLATFNDKGEIEGVKYAQIATVLVNAVKEQQAQIEAQQKQIEAQKKQIENLTKAVCSMNPKADICPQKK